MPGLREPTAPTYAVCSVSIAALDASAAASADRRRRRGWPPLPGASLQRLHALAGRPGPPDASGAAGRRPQPRRRLPGGVARPQGRHGRAGARRRPGGPGRGSGRGHAPPLPLRRQAGGRRGDGRAPRPCSRRASRWSAASRRRSPRSPTSTSPAWSTGSGRPAPTSLWIGLGTPRQDYLVHLLSADLSMPIVPVGAAFDFWAGHGQAGSPVPARHRPGVALPARHRAAPAVAALPDRQPALPAVGLAAPCLRPVEIADMRVLVAHNRYRSSAPSGENQIVAAEIDLLRSGGSTSCR